jgi:hypothetical protein
MNVDNVLSAPMTNGSQIPAIGQPSDWNEATPAKDLPCDAILDLIEDGPEYSARGEDKFGVHKEVLFDFRDYGLD